MKQSIIGAIVAGIALFIWGFLYWGLNPLPYQALGHPTDDAALGQALLEYLPASGSYFVPGRHLEEAELTRLHDSGPIAFIFFTKGGAPVMDGQMMGTGLVHGILFAFLLAIVLQRVGPESYMAGLKLSGLIGLASGFFIHFGDAIWWRMAWDWKFHTFLYTVLAFLVTGAVLMKFVGRKA